MGLSHTVSGDIASFRTPSRVPIESLKFHFLPKQAEGTPSPENPIPIEGWTGLNGRRAGKNLLPNNIVAGTEHSQGLTFVQNLDGSIQITGKGDNTTTKLAIIKNFPNGAFPLKAGTYRPHMWSTDTTKSQIYISIMYNDGDNSMYCNANGSSYSYTLAEDVYVNQIQIGLQPSEDVEFNLTIYPSLEKNNIPTSWEPCRSELIPIAFPVAGMNKIDPSTIVPEMRISVSDGIYSNTGADTRTFVQLQVQLWKTTGTYIKSVATLNNITTTGRKSLTFDVDTEDCHYIAFKHNGIVADFRVLMPFSLGLGTYTLSIDLLSADPTTVGGFRFKDVQLEVGDTAHAYEAYSLDNTFYGGYYDPVAGEIVAEYEMITDAWKNWTVRGEALGNKIKIHRFNNLVNSVSGGGGICISNVAKKMWKDTEESSPHFYITYTTSTVPNYNSVHMFLPLDLDEDTIVQVLATLITPIHIPIPAQDLKAFLDHNNFWSDANDITEVTYAVTESKDMLMTRKMIMDGNQPHLEEASGSIANFETNIRAPLKSAIFEIKPIQDGSGDPDPENERSIKGFTGLTIVKSNKNLAKLSNEILLNDRVQNGMTFHALNDSSVHIEGTADGDSFLTSGHFKGNPNLRLLKAGTYTLTTNFPNGNSGGSVVYMYGFDVEGNNVGTFAQAYAERTPTTFTLQKDTYVNIQMIVKSGYTMNVDVWVQLEKGSSSTAYEPHSEESFELTFPKTKNLLELEESEIVGSGWNRYIPNPISEPGVYSISCEQEFGGTGTKGGRIVFVTAPNNQGELVGSPFVSSYAFGSSIMKRTNLSVTQEQADAAYMGFQMNSNGLTYEEFVNAKIQIEKGSYITGYEPYGTVYGGYINLARQKLVVEYYRGVVTSAAGKQGNFFYNVTSNIGMPAIEDTNAGLKASHFPNNPNVSESATTQGITIYHNQIMRWIDEDHINSTLSEYNDYLSNNPFEIVYKRKIPIEYDISIEQIKTFIGKNNIWSNTNGETILLYWTH